MSAEDFRFLGHWDQFWGRWDQYKPNEFHMGRTGTDVLGGVLAGMVGEGLY